MRSSILKGIMLTFQEKLDQIVDKNDSLVSVGLDADFNKLPEQFKKSRQPQFAFNQWIIEQTHAFVSAYKPNMAFYEARGAQGWGELKSTIDYLREHYPEIVTICDAKRADIGSTNEEYAAAIFDELEFDAVTLHPYLGKEALEPFLAREDKGCIILCRTSNPGAGEIQDLLVLDNQQASSTNDQVNSNNQFSHSQTLWEHVAWIVSHEWSVNGNCMLVVGATYPAELKRVREIVGEMTLLVPGIGAQGGNLEQVMHAGLTQNKQGLLISASRNIIFSDNPREEAKNLRDDINRLRKLSL